MEINSERQNYNHHFMTFKFFDSSVRILRLNLIYLSKNNKFIPSIP